MYNVVEFSEDAGGGVSVIRREWLTPRKQRCMWPSQNLMKKFNKCINGSIVADYNTWDIFNIKRVFYETDNLAKAREKEKEAEVDSEVNSDNKLSIRKRKKSRKILDSESDTDAENNIDTHIHHIVYPKHPTTKWAPDNNHQNQEAENKRYIQRTPDTSTDEEKTSEKCQNKTAANKVRSRPPPVDVATSDEEWALDHKNQAASNKVWPRPSTSFDEGNIEDQKNHCATPQNDPLMLPNSTLGSLDLTLTPFFKETPSSQALDVIAKHLARIESEIRELQISQNDMFQRLLRSSSTTPFNCALPDEISLPCDDYEALVKIETWISAADENKKLLVSYLSLVGGTKKPVIIRRILEKVFTNKLAVLCNWTGKNKKIPLKNLELMNIIKDAVRQNYIAEKATDAEIHEVISNWFRFTKDRDGGREARRVKS